MKMLTILFDEFLAPRRASAASLADSDSRCRSTDLITSLYISLYVLTDSTAIIRKRSVTFLSSDFLNIRKSDQGISPSDIEVNIGSGSTSLGSSSMSATIESHNRSLQISTAPGQYLPPVAVTSTEIQRIQLTKDNFGTSQAA